MIGIEGIIRVRSRINIVFHQRGFAGNNRVEHGEILKR